MVRADGMTLRMAGLYVKAQQPICNYFPSCSPTAILVLRFISSTLRSTDFCIFTTFTHCPSRHPHALLHYENIVSPFIPKFLSVSDIDWVYHEAFSNTTLHHEGYVLYD